MEQWRYVVLGLEQLAMYFHQSVSLCSMLMLKLYDPRHFIMLCKSMCLPGHISGCNILHLKSRCHMLHLSVLLCSMTGWRVFSITASKKILICSVQEENYKVCSDKKANSSWQSLIRLTSNPAMHAITVLQQPSF